VAKKSNSKKSTAPARKPSAPPVAKKVKKPVRPVAKASAAKAASAPAKPAAKPARKPIPAKAVTSYMATLKAKASAAHASALSANRLAAKPPKKIKCPLTKSELEEFRRVLLDKRRAILGDMNSIEADALRTNRQDGSGDLSNMPTHPADIGSDNFEQEFTLGLLDSERKLLSEINAALERVEAGTFGVCVGTGEAIGMPRLRARPWAKYCIEYAKMLEKGLVIPEEDRAPSASDDDEDDDDVSPAENDSDDMEEAEDDDGFGQDDSED